MFPTPAVPCLRDCPLCIYTYSVPLSLVRSSVLVLRDFWCFHACVPVPVFPECSLPVFPVRTFEFYGWILDLPLLAFLLRLHLHSGPNPELHL